MLRRTLARTGRRTQGWGWSPPRPRHGQERLSSVTTNAGDGLSIHWSRRADAGAEQRIGPNSEEIHAAAVAGYLACRSMPRLTGRSPDSGAHPAANCGGEQPNSKRSSNGPCEGGKGLRLRSPPSRRRPPQGSGLRRHLPLLPIWLHLGNTLVPRHAPVLCPRRGLKLGATMPFLRAEDQEPEPPVVVLHGPPP